MKEVIQWVVEGRAPHMQELRGKVQDIMNMRQIFNAMLFVMKNGGLGYNKHKNPTRPCNTLHICPPEARLKEAFQICHEGIMSGHRGVAGMLDKFQGTSFVLSASDKVRRLVEQRDICLTKREVLNPG